MSGSHPASRDMDMLHGPVARKMLVFALPVALTGLFQQLFTAADIFVLGRFVGKEAMAAAGNNIPAISLIINLYTGLALGANVVIARCIGSGDRNGTRSAVQTAVLLSLISGIAIAAMGIPLSRTVTELLGVPEEVFTMSEDYLRIYFYGIPALAFFNFAAAILRSRGDTRTPLFALIQSTILNIVLNLAFVKAGWGLGGVVWATDIANYWAAVFLFIGLIRTPGSVRLVLAGMRADMGHLKEILRIGLPAGLQSAVFAISNIVIQSAINSLGKVVMAASSAAYNIEVFAYDVMNSYNQACTTFVGQNYGAGQIRRCRKTLYLCLIEDAVSLGATVALVLLTGHFLLSIFNNDPQVIALGYDRLKIVFFAYIFSLLYEVMSGYLRGFGISLVPAALTALGVCGIRIAWIHFVFPQHPTLQTIMTSYPVSLSATALMIFIALLCYRPARKHAAMEREPAPAGN